MINASTCCLAFDLDDTLFLERDYVMSGLRQVGLWVRDNLGIPDFFDRAWKLFEAGVRGKIFDNALESCRLSPNPELLSILVELYRAHDPDISLLPDARSCLEELRGQFRMAVVTDGPLQSQRAKAHALGLGLWMDPIVFTAELGLGLGKPHPRPFRMIEEQTDCSGSQCVYVADNPKKDFVGPKSLGWTTVRVRRPSGLHAHVESGPDVDLEHTDLWGFAETLGLLRGAEVSDPVSIPGEVSRG